MFTVGCGDGSGLREQGAGRGWKSDPPGMPQKMLALKVSHCSPGHYLFVPASGWLQQIQQFYFLLRVSFHEEAISVVHLKEHGEDQVVSDQLTQHGKQVKFFCY